jgi:hypothetical protein
LLGFQPGIEKQKLLLIQPLVSNNAGQYALQTAQCPFPFPRKAERLSQGLAIDFFGYVQNGLPVM